VSNAGKFTCLWPGCNVEGRAWCLAHWGRLPASLRERLQHVFASGDRFDETMHEAKEWAAQDDRRVEMVKRGWTYDL
jgi:hypothetical protein